MSDTVAWPPAIGLTTKIVPRKDAILTIPYSTVVRAPASLVFDTLLRVKEYKQWNTWVPVVEIKSPGNDLDNTSQDQMSIGCSMQFDVIMNADKPHDVTQTQLKVVDISTPSAPSSYLTPDLLEDPTFTADLTKVYRVSWTGNGGMYGFAPKLERFHEVIVLGDNECEVRSWEIMSGMTSRLVKLLMEDMLKAKVALWCEDLKEHCERVHGTAA